jgi:hypothetical protein
MKKKLQLLIHYKSGDERSRVLSCSNPRIEKIICRIQKI